MNLSMSGLFKWSGEETFIAPSFTTWSQGPRIAEGQFHTAVTESKKAWSISDFLCSLPLGTFPSSAAGLHLL